MVKDAIGVYVESLRKHNEPIPDDEETSRRDSQYRSP